MLYNQLFKQLQGDRTHEILQQIHKELTQIENNIVSSKLLQQVEKHLLVQARMMLSQLEKINNTISCSKSSSAKSKSIVRSTLKRVIKTKKKSK